jgi:hypothetical protein
MVKLETGSVRSVLSIVATCDTLITEWNWHGDGFLDICLTKSCAYWMARRHFKVSCRERGHAETRTKLDGYGGNTRNHDLVVNGRVPDARANLDLEARADEAFGETIAQRLAKTQTYLRENPRSNAEARVRELCAAVSGCRAATLRYRAAGLAVGGAGMANFAASIRAFACTSLSSIVDRPSVQVTTRRKGTLTPATSR